MNKLKNISALALLLFGCAKETNLESQYGEGSVLFECVTEQSVGVTTKADDDTQTYYEIPAELIPSGDEFSLHLTGSYIDAETLETMSYDRVYTTLKDYNDNIPLLSEGSYKAEISYGDMTIENEENPCFTGELEFEIYARLYDEQTITASLSNSMIRLETDEWFDKYYSQAQFTITTSAENEFEFTQGGEEAIYFVAPESTLTLKGSAINAQTGAEVEFPETTIGETTKQTISTIVVNADQAASLSFNVSFNQTFTFITLDDIELNPENNEDVEVEKPEVDENTDEDGEVDNSDTQSDNQTEA